MQTFLEHLNSIESLHYIHNRTRRRGKNRFSGHHQEDGKLTIIVYRKPIHTDRYLSYFSHHPNMHKRAVVKSLADRAEKIPTTKSDRNREKQRIISTLQSNGYPKRFIVNASKPKQPLNLSSNGTESERGFCTIPYVSATSEPIKRVLDEHDIKVAFKPFFYDKPDVS